MWDVIEPTERTDGPSLYDGRVLVAVVPTSRDWERIRQEGWYRIPLSRAPRRLGAEYLAFYHTKSGGALRWTISHYAMVRGFRLARRRELVPDEPDHPHADDLYYRVELGPLESLPHPIPSRKLRRVTFIATTLGRLLSAGEINELWEREAARDRLWRALQAREIPAERDYVLEEGRTRRIVDLAVRCARGIVAVDCEGATEDQIVREERSSWDHGSGDNLVLLRLGIDEIMTALEGCVERVRASISACGGLPGSENLDGQFVQDVLPEGG
jgi:hypothetical protein